MFQLRIGRRDNRNNFMKKIDTIVLLFHFIEPNLKKMAGAIVTLSQLLV